MLQACPVCSHDGLASTLTYKHVWHTCQRCLNTTRERRDRYPAERLPRLPRLPSTLERMLYPGPAVIDEPERFYDYYAQAAERRVEQTKWQAQIDRVTGRLVARGAKLDGAILDVSGGPGFLTRHLAQTARRAVVTEYSPRAVVGMREALGVEAVTFDYQADRIGERVSGPFNTVVIDASLNFCRDVPRFARDLASVCAPDALVYASFTVPTLGCCLRWGYDDYTYEVLYQPQTVVQSFNIAGFRLASSEWDAPFDYRTGVGGKMRALRAPLELNYRRRAAEPLNRSLLQLGAVHYYYLSPPGSA